MTNLSKAKKNWVLISRIIGQEGANAWKSRNFFKTVAQVVILFGLEIWVMTLHVSKTLGRFHHRVARWLTVKQPRRLTNGGWEYPPLGGTMRDSGLEEVETYITRIQNRVVQYISTWPILDLCEKAEKRTLLQVSKWCWDQEGINLDGEQVAAVVAAET